MKQVRLTQTNGLAVAFDPEKVVAVRQHGSTATYIDFLGGETVLVNGEFGTISDRVWHPDDPIV